MKLQNIHFSQGNKQKISFRKPTFPSRLPIVKSKIQNEDYVVVHLRQENWSFYFGSSNIIEENITKLLTLHLIHLCPFKSSILLLFSEKLCLMTDPCDRLSLFIIIKSTKETKSFLLRWPELPSG